MEENQKETIDFLGGQAIFATCSRKEIETALAYIKYENFESDEIIFESESKDKKFYMIKSGNVFVKDVELDTESELKDGDFFGEIALFFNEEARGAKATATSQTSCLTISYEDFSRMSSEEPHVACKLLFQITRIIGIRQAAMNEVLYVK